ncbi:sepiapterin reductase [Drosophila tropicalis]|uniref:sepiapterin reductase n=1 Tax=Drosophila tropicalis TaxID=46794 RepID=UPI0035AC1790
MASKRMDLNRSTFLVLSGCSNPLGQSLATQLCNRLGQGSVALILDENHQELQKLEKELKAQLDTHSEIHLELGQLNVDHSNGVQLMESVLKKFQNMQFQRSIIVHNEGEASTHCLLEPQMPKDWTNYVQQQLYAPVALNQRWLNSNHLQSVEKLAINVTSSLQVRPMVYNGLLCSCKRARDMYFRAMASEEEAAISNTAGALHVLNYGPGLLTTHQTQCDLNGNVIEPEELLADSLSTISYPELPRRVQPLQSTLKLINILEEISFVSGHDVDYYDTFVL